MSSNLIEGTNLYIILGCGRTGSNYLRDKLSNPIEDRDGTQYSWPGGVCSAIGTSEDSINGLNRARAISSNVVMHTHNKDIVGDLGILPQDVTLIVSKRRNHFETCMSHITAYITGEWHHYTDKSPIPRVVSVERFQKLATNLLRWYDDIDISLPYKRVHTIYYEDVVVGDVQFLRSVLGLDHISPNPPEYRFPPCPHKYKQWILNWEALYEEYLKIADVAQ